MKLENNWKSKTLEHLEKEIWKDSEFESYIIKSVHDLRKLPLEKFTAEDLRIMIGQNVGLNYLIPLALEVLTENLWAEGDYYEGDLLNSALNINADFWISNKNYWLKLNDLVKDSRPDLEKKKIDTTTFTKVQFVMNTLI